MIINIKNILNVPESDFMILAFKCKKKYKKIFLPSAVHIDGTARPQVVRKKKQIKNFLN